MIDAISYIAVIASLSIMKLSPRQSRPATTKMWQELQEGWRYVAGCVPIRMVLILFAIVSFMGVP